MNLNNINQSDLFNQWPVQPVKCQQWLSLLNLNITRLFFFFLLLFLVGVPLHRAGMPAIFFMIIILNKNVFYTLSLPPHSF